MAESTSSAKRRQRSDAREQRRSLAAEPFEQLDEAARQEDGGGTGRRTIRQAATTAVAGAVAAGVAGAAKALLDGRRSAQPASDADEARDDEPADEGERDESEERQDARAEAEAPPEEPEQQSEPEDEEPAPEESSDTAAQGAPADEAKAVVEHARRELQELLGVEPERVSGFERSQGRWTVTLEVVEVRRVPDTTDVLSSYEVALDDDRNVLSVSEKRRYRRSQVEEGR
jgi:hypothetical protein